MHGMVIMAIIMVSVLMKRVALVVEEASVTICHLTYLIVHVKILRLNLRHVLICTFLMMVIHAKTMKTMAGKSSPFLSFLFSKMFVLF